MFNAFRQEDPDLIAAIADVYSTLAGLEAHEKDYASAVDQLVKLQTFKKKNLDPNTLITVIGNLVIGFAVLKYEGTGVITTKLWSFMSKI